MGKLQKKPVKKKVVKKKKNGRPAKKLDYSIIDNLCALHCTGEEIAAFLNVDYDTLNAGIKRKTKKTFSEYFAIKSSKGKISLRRKQYELAMAGDKVMLIWLGKQYLGQVDKKELELPGFNDKNVTINIQPI